MYIYLQNIKKCSEEIYMDIATANNKSLITINKIGIVSELSPETRQHH